MKRDGRQRHLGIVAMIGLGVVVLWATSFAGQQEEVGTNDNLDGGGHSSQQWDGGGLKDSVGRKAHPSLPAFVFKFPKEALVFRSSDPHKKELNNCLAAIVKREFDMAAATGYFFLPGKRCPNEGYEKHNYSEYVISYFENKQDIIKKCFNEWHQRHPRPNSKPPYTESDLQTNLRTIVQYQFKNNKCDISGYTHAQSQ